MTVLINSVLLAIETEHYISSAELIPCIKTIYECRGFCLMVIKRYIQICQDFPINNLIEYESEHSIQGIRPKLPSHVGLTKPTSKMAGAQISFLFYMLLTVLQIIYSWCNWFNMSAMLCTFWRFPALQQHKLKFN